MADFRNGVWGREGDVLRERHHQYLYLNTHITSDKLRENLTYSIGAVIDSVSNVLEETTDIANEGSTIAVEGAINAEITVCGGL